MRILVVSCNPWRKDNSIGNTYTNLFNGMEDIEIAHICCGGGTPDVDFVKYHLHISERNILKNLINPKHKCCRIITSSNQDMRALDKRKKAVDFMRSHRLQLFFLLRDLIWSFKNWICDDLKDFVDQFNPDIIFAHFLDRGYLNEMLFFLKEYTKVPVVVYAWDDVYTLKQFSLSPIFWINRFLQRKKLRKLSELSSLMYVISEKQRMEYSRLFGRSCRILYKGYDFEEQPTYEIKNQPVKLVYSGNIGTGRYKTLALIGSALHEINRDGIKAVLYIYTSTPLNLKMRRLLDYPESIHRMKSVPSEEIAAIQQEADILIHVEGFDLKQRFKVRLSFSTKLVDYFYSGRCIFAVGNKDIASIEYLSKNHGAVIAYKKSEIIRKLSRLINSPSLRKKYAKQSWECGWRNHQRKHIQSTLENDLKTLLHGK
ncbi:hypothetical protein H0486_11145 [Lachnospiraceae bacterium MD1]|uniref:Glycosyltransferase family 4 protein n=1 Tax=Variimorphobacter saccharofermentans TaxID=2755051 RepID=A0A839K0J4_9FIRM|nr:hypothetical protein [Variimorphobacter saccharofermentans]MBB2183435.1 hypothetical protein [Variimorphobacter saccharofermentans]